MVKLWHFTYGSGANMINKKDIMWFPSNGWYRGVRGKELPSKKRKILIFCFFTNLAVFIIFFRTKKCLKRAEIFFGDHQQPQQHFLGHGWPFPYRIWHWMCIKVDFYKIRHVVFWIWSLILASYHSPIVIKF